MKIILLGNMNNNFFSLLRFLRNKGLDAHLYVPPGLPKHFQPQEDTVCLEQWQPFIHSFPLAATVQNMYIRLPQHHKLLHKLRHSADIVLTEGYFPALFRAYGLKIDIFIPYADHIEGTEHAMWGQYSLKYSIARSLIRRLQIPSIQSAVTITGGISYLTQVTLKKVNLKSKSLFIPMVYSPELPKLTALPPVVSSVINFMQAHTFIVMSHSRQTWATTFKYTDSSIDTKKMDLLIQGFASFIKQGITEKPLLVLFEYGRDVDASKALVKELNIEQYVYWLPLMPRKDILPLISYCDIGAGEFGTDFWGGVGWEILALGKVLINRYTLPSAEFQSKFGFPPPNIMAASTAEEIEASLIKAATNRQWLKRAGEENAQWYLDNIAYKTVEHIKNICENPSI